MLAAADAIYVAMARDTSFFDPHSLQQFSSSEMNCQNNMTTFPMIQMTTTTNTFSSIESSGSDQYVDRSEFEVSDFFSFEDWGNEHQSVGFVQASQNFGFAGNDMYDVGGNCSNQYVEDNNMGSISNSTEKKERVAFRMRSEVDIVDDGYRWRKYGKKMVKNNPNPRNYYRCSKDGCPVKKRVERDRVDKRYVITTYEANHNHQSSS